MPNMAYKLRGNLFILAHNQNPPEASIWDAYVAEVSNLGAFARMRTLVLTEGGGPDVKQRAALNAVLKGRSTPTAVVSSSLIVRGIVSALNVMNNDIRTFSHDSLQQALSHLHIAPLDQSAVLRDVASLRGEVSQVTARTWAQ